MSQTPCSDAEFTTLFEGIGPTETAKRLDITIRAVLLRRRRLELKTGRALIGPKEMSPINGAYAKRIPLELENGVVIIGSDAHYWPDEITPAHRGLVKLVGDLNPAAVILNGDVLDGARISRHPKIGWAQPPTLRAELDAVDERLEEIRKASKKAKRYWLLGNHCMRFENKLANESPEFEGIPGFSLREQFQTWDFGLSLWINNDVVVKHRFKGGVHATHNNTLYAGKSIVTGHLHSLKVTPFADYNGNRFGIDTGTLSNPYGEHADYAEDAPLNHRSGFIVLTFHNGKLLWPEIVFTHSENEVEFRGQIIKV